MEKECQVFTRYLVRVHPERYILGKYAQARAPGGILSAEPANALDRILLKIAVTHPVLTHITDIYSRFFYPSSSVRRRLVFLLALLESWGPTSSRLQAPGRGGKAGFYPGMLVLSLYLSVMLVLTAVLFLPFRFMNRQRTRNHGQ